MEKITRYHSAFPPAQGLYDSRCEKDACGVGFVCDVKGRKSSSIVQDGLNVLLRLAHRGAVGSDPDTGDGAGILIQIPDEFLRHAAEGEGFSLPKKGRYGTGLIFFPVVAEERQFCKRVVRKVVEEEGQRLLGWRAVPVDNSKIGEGARETEPVFEQVFIEAAKEMTDQTQFERILYVIRKRVENIVRSQKLRQRDFFYITNISSYTLAYKGLLMPHQVRAFFLDLQDSSLTSAIALVHSRYSTNTFPTWDLAQPFRYLAHNGEINTLQGNLNWMRAREGLLQSSVFGEKIDALKPVLLPGVSDSATIDSAFELLVRGGRSLAHAMMMLIPGAWEHNALLDQKLREFYRYHACFMEPWDGPAAIAFTDGRSIGAVLDRNGLRPARYLVTTHDTVVMASEVGVLDIPSEQIRSSGRLEPGKMFYIDTEAGRIVSDREIKETVAAAKPYGAWLKEHLCELDRRPEGREKKEEEKVPRFQRMQMFGYTREDLHAILAPMARKGVEPTGSMGNDAPLAVLSEHDQLLYNYFKQLFAQVTNPAIDPIREECVMSMISFVGRQENILGETPRHCHKLMVKEPILTNEDFQKLYRLDNEGFHTRTIAAVMEQDTQEGITDAIDRICAEAEEAVAQGDTLLVISDRSANAERVPLPMLLATGAVHHHLIRQAKRTQIGIIVESGEPREVHHFALLFGYGADCINPYMAYEILEMLAADRSLEPAAAEAIANYRKASVKGILKILSKMGISTLNSYRGAQIFEALGIHREVIDRCFEGTASRIGGVRFSEIEQEARTRHRRAFARRNREGILATGGVYQWKRDGEFHLWNPESIAALQDAARQNDYERYLEFSRLINDQSAQPATLRGLLKFGPCRSIPLEEVESEERIFTRFATGAMSYGSISRGAHETLAVAMNRIGGKSNTGEGGEDPARFTPLPSGDSKRSAIKQVASGRFGVSTNYLTNADEIQIKIAQGAKPGEGGQLPGHKVSVTIARTRYTTPGVTLISPPPHHDIYSIEDLAQLIFDLKNTNPRARISVKLVSEIGVGTIAAGVAKGHADMILISGGDGGTGASPKSSIRHAGLPWELGLAETHQTLVLNDLRSRVRLQTDGQMRTGRDVAIAAILGAEEYGFCTAALIVMGCVMLRHCHLNNCAVGVATQDDILEGRFRGRAEHVVNYFRFVARELREIMAGLGVRTVDELIGRTDLLEVNAGIVPSKAAHIDYSRILYKPEVPPQIGTYCTIRQNHQIAHVLDRKLIELAHPALAHSKPVQETVVIENTDRTTGAMLSGEICRLYGEGGLPEDTVRFSFHGVAGQSFGAWLAHGVTFELRGLANDYVGKGISGGRIIVRPGEKAGYCPGENVIIGNTTFYGAIRGEAYIRGLAGERFCIRNSGLQAVVEGVGDHGCEYMTGGKVVILGPTGRNFAAGMSGGIAYVYDPHDEFPSRCNMHMVELEPLTEDDGRIVALLIKNHLHYTGSTIASRILDDMKKESSHFVKVMPVEYKRILEAKKVEQQLDVAEPADG
ncbi:MAG: glutamate synthase large subunit [Candidatus Omnitrophica bacterium]|nr:glutamate synthase large subunit [Candidatus Omnitrophota bacterium]